MLARLCTALVAMSLVCLSGAQDFFHRPSPLAGMFIVSLATFPEVQKEVKLTPDDAKKIDAALADVGDQMQGAFQDSGGDFGKLQVAVGTITTKADTDYLKTLTPDQAKRLRELFVQFNDARVIVRDDFGKELALTDDQRAKVKQLQMDQGKKIGDLFQSGGDPASLAPEMKKLQDAFTKDLSAVLTDDQKKKLEDMKGAKFEFQKPASS